MTIQAFGGAPVRRKLSLDRRGRKSAMIAGAQDALPLIPPLQLRELVAAMVD